MGPGRLDRRTAAPYPRGAALHPGRRAAWRAGRLAALLALLLLGAPLRWSALATPGYAQAEVVIHGETLRLDIADTPAKQALGLGGRTALSPHAGMLFVYAERGRQAFWMHGMRISIDIVWLDNTRVVHIEHDVPPPAPGTPDAQLPTYQPQVPANFVLELAAGRARALKLQVGQQVQFRFDVR